MDSSPAKSGSNIWAISEAHFSKNFAAARRCLESELGDYGIAIQEALPYGYSVSNRRNHGRAYHGDHAIRARRISHCAHSRRGARHRSALALDHRHIWGDLTDAGWRQYHAAHQSLR